jgi:hypothetical protein
MTAAMTIGDAGAVPAWGPKMAALANDKQRAFVCALFDAPPKGKGQLIWAATTAGYGTSTSSKKSLSVIASRLAMQPAVQDALHEEAHRRFKMLPAAAIPALEQLLKSPGHRDHSRGIAMVLDRFAPVETRTTVRIEDTRPPTPEAIATVLARIEELARRAGIALPPPPTIDAEFKIVEAAGS